jgi:hypothetical protein
MRQHGEHRFTACTLDAPDGETAKPNAGIVGVASQKAAAGTGRCVVELKANGEDEGEDELDERFAIAKELRVGRLIVEIDSEGAILAWCFGGLCHVSSPLGWWLIRMRHGESNILKDQAYWKRLRVLPLNPMECGILERAQETWAMAGLGPRSAIERAEIGNSRPTVVRACALLDRERDITP